jgi:dipeptidyl aminopeptidase/acylaminoacyl peptidase
LPELCLAAKFAVMTPPHVRLRKLLMFVGFACSGLAATIRMPAQEPASPAPDEGRLNTYLNREPTDAAGQLALLQQNMLIEQSDTTQLLFLLEYGSRIHIERTYFPATTSDHEMVPCYMFTPASMVPGTRHPGVVLVHGGFHEKLDWRFFSLIDALVGRGFVVIFPEYRGSSGYGETIYRNSYGTTDVADVLAAADYFATKPYVDPHRMGILGHSRGGMVVLLALERAPQRFQAGVEICGLMDFLAYMTYKPDARRQEVANEDEFGGKLPSQDLAAYLEISPLNHVESIQTPLLALATTGDKIVPVSLNTVRLIELLKAHQKVFDSHVYDQAPGGHVFIFGDSPAQRDCFQRSLDWLAQYLHP